MNTVVTLLRTLTPLHVGTGQAIGPVDLPIARERSTHWPLIPGSSFKGVLRDAATEAQWDQAMKVCGNDPARAEDWCVQMLAETFGRAGEPDQNFAGRLSVTDQRILLFPVRSYFGTFAYVTCPLALARAAELIEMAGRTMPPCPPLDGDVLADTTNSLFDGGKAYFEDLDLTGTTADLSPLATFLATQLDLGVDRVLPRIAIVSDTLFSFLVENATEVVTHVTLNFQTKTAKEKFLRSEESVPAEAVFVGLATALRCRVDPLDEVRARVGPLQFGGKASVGMGICKLTIAGGEAA